MNEGRGNTLWDLSGAGHGGTLTDMDLPGDWVDGPHGHGLDFDGTNDRAIFGPETGIPLGTANACVIRLKVRSLGGQTLVGHDAWDDGGYFLSINGSSLYYCAAGHYVTVPHGMTVGDEVWLGVSRQGTTVMFYKDGVVLGTPQTLSANAELLVSTIGAYRVSPYYAANMRCDYVYCWARSLSAGEMAWLYREPFCFVTRRPVLPNLCFVSTTIHAVSGSANAVSTAIADAAVIPFCDRPTGRPWQKAVLDIEAFWLREALLNGMTDTAAKLGTALTQGWFWMRRVGCSAVYRLENPHVEFRNSNLGFGSPVCVTAADAKQVLLPTYLAHEAGSTCCYVVRRFNSCGQQDQTTHALVCVRIGPDGQLATPASNPTFGGHFEIQKSKVESGHVACLEWFYCPLDHAAPPQVFNVYWDGGTGGIDFDNTVAVVPYEGGQGRRVFRPYYCYQSLPLASGKYLFAIRAESMDGAEGPPRRFEFQISNSEITEGPDILEVESI